MNWFCWTSSKARWRPTTTAGWSELSQNCRPANEVSSRRGKAKTNRRSVRKVVRAVQDVFGADLIERERRNGLTLEVQFREIDRAHPAVVHRPIIIDPVAHVGDDRPLRVAEIEVLGAPAPRPPPSFGGVGF